MTICPRAIGESGEKVVSEVPRMIPASTAQYTALLQPAQEETSVNFEETAATGLPCILHRYSTAEARVHSASPSKQTLVHRRDIVLVIGSPEQGGRLGRFRLRI